MIFNFNRLMAAVALSASAAAFTGALAQTPAAPVQATGAWARASVQGQSGTGAFMTLTVSQPTRLVGASSPAAGIAEVHEMKMDGDIMRMRPVAGLDLAPGKPLELKPGGYHVMLMNLKAPLAKDSSVPLTLLFKDAAGKDSKLELQVPVRASAPAMGDMPMHKH